MRGKMISTARVISSRSCRIQLLLAIVTNRQTHYVTVSSTHRGTLKSCKVIDFYLIEYKVETIVDKISSHAGLRLKYSGV